MNPPFLPCLRYRKVKASFSKKTTMKAGFSIKPRVLAVQVLITMLIIGLYFTWTKQSIGVELYNSVKNTDLAPGVSEVPVKSSTNVKDVPVESSSGLEDYSPTMPEKMYNEDLMMYFNVTFISSIIEHDDVKEVLDMHNATLDEEYEPEKKEKVYDVLGPQIEGLGGRGEKRFYVKGAGEKGYGVFANEYIKRMSIIGLYTGERTASSLDTKYEWTYQSEPEDNFGDKVYIGTDGKYMGNMLRFINDGKYINCKMVQVVWKNRWYPIYVATKDIHPGEELSVSYGSSYWEDRDFKP